MVLRKRLRPVYSTPPATAAASRAPPEEAESASFAADHPAHRPESTTVVAEPMRAEPPASTLSGLLYSLSSFPAESDSARMWPPPCTAADTLVRALGCQRAPSPAPSPE